MNRRDFARLGLSVSTLTALSKTTPAQVISTGPGKVHGEGTDIRRVGVRVNGAYWKAGQESIDALSGNLNIAVPVLTAKSRGLSVPLQLSYNSQNWEKTSSGSIIRNGLDLGVGFGWRLHFGCIVPASGGEGYTYLDGTGAEYILYSVSDGWASQQGIRATFVPSTSQLCFWNGVVWTLGCKSASGEADAGALYPTLIQDTNGNQILITYAAGEGSTSADTSARIVSIADARAQSVANGRATYQFEYNSEGGPHLSSISSLIGTGESPQFSYSGSLVSDPWTGIPYNAPQISEVVMPSGLNTYFSYNSSGTVKTAQFPHGASIDYTYTDFTFSDGRSVTEITSRSVSPSNGNDGFQVSFTRPSGDSSLICHSRFTATESPAGRNSGIRSWTFSTNLDWEIGLALSYTEANSSGTVRRQTSYTWVQNTDGTPYISSTSVTLDPGTSSAATTKVQVSKDPYGNTTQLTHYDYNSSTPLRTVNNSYLNSSTYTSKFIRNRLTSSNVVANGQTTPLASHVYDSTSLTSRSGLQEHDSENYGPSNTVRGNPTESTVGGVYSKRSFDITGLPVSTQDSAGSSVAFTPSPNTNNATIGTITPNGNSKLSKQVTYDTALRPLVTTGPNAATVKRTYDSAGRVASVTSADGSQTTYAYATNPTTITATKNGRWSKVIHDNFGRPGVVQRGTGSTTASQVNYSYGQSPNSPNGKLLTRTLPFAPGGKASNLNYSYDEIGRLTSATQPSSGGTVTYSRSGKSTTVTDPAGRWKTLAHSADGTLASVQTPGAGSTPTFQTNYSYNGIKKLTTVNMPRPEGTQQRTFSYDSGGRPLTRNHVETGPKNYTYNNDGTVATFKDNMGQSAVWNYDANKRVTALKRYYAGGSQDVATSRQFYYDTNPFDPSYSQNAQGRLTAVQWGSTVDLPGQFTQMYSYTALGACWASG